MLLDLQVIAVVVVGVVWLLYLRLLTPIASRLEQVNCSALFLQQVRVYRHC